MQSSKYKITTAAVGGTACATAAGATKSQACTVKACPVDCVGAYGSWSTCSKTCGAGTQSTAYKITTASAKGGAACAAKAGSAKSQACTVKDCPVDCAGSYAWSVCSTSCGPGTQIGNYKITTAEAHGGNACAAGNAKSQPCMTQLCTGSPSPPVAAAGGNAAEESSSLLIFIIVGGVAVVGVAAVAAVVTRGNGDSKQLWLEMQQTTAVASALPTGSRFHFFVSKHEKHKFVALNIAEKLRGLRDLDLAVATGEGRERGRGGDAKRRARVGRTHLAAHSRYLPQGSRMGLEPVDAVRHRPRQAHHLHSRRLLRL